MDEIHVAIALAGVNGTEAGVFHPIVELFPVVRQQIEDIPL
jgi:hypothetical protein